MEPLRKPAATILVVGLTPACQRTLYFDAIEAGRVNRARQVLETVAGKGPNVTRFVRQLGGRSLLLTVAGGLRGQWLRQQIRREGWSARIMAVRAETRICQTLIGGRTVTELVEEGGPLSRAEVAEVLREFRSLLRRAGMVILSGSVPKGCGDDFYARLIRLARRHAVPVLVDAQRNQLRNAVREKPLLVRITRDELAEALGMSCETMEMTCRAARKLVANGVSWAIVSDGGNPVVALGPGCCWIARPPRIQVGNPVGSGDAMMAGIAVGLARHGAMREALRLGIACGAANAMTATSAEMDLTVAKRLARQVRFAAAN